jgi:hypothetical protein
MVMTPKSRKTKVRFLAHQKFPRLIDPPGAPPRWQRSSELVSLEEIEAQRHLAALSELSDSELDDQYEKAVEALRAEADRADGERSFNQPCAPADGNGVLDA